MKINQIIVENFDGEYDDEAGMAQTNLHTIARAAQGLLDTIDDKENLPEWVQEKIAKVEGMMVTAWDYLLSQEEQGMDPQMMEAANAAQQAAIAISMKKAGKKPKNESAELEEEFDLIESIIERLAAHNGVDAEVIWEDLETLTEDELYAFAVTSEPIMESQGVAEGLSEARNSLFAFVKQQFPTWPDYVLKDFLYAQAKGIRDQAELDDFLKRNKQDFGNCKWTLTKLPITFDIFTPKTQRMLASREGGSSNPFQVPRDAERHALQSQMIQQKGVSAEPIIVAKLSNGYDLIEGWHRTIQHLKAFPQGYTGPAWVCTGATYKSESVEQGVAEAGFPGAPDVEMPPMKPSGDPERDKLKNEYVDLHREIKSLVDAAYGGNKRAKARIAQLNDRADQIRAILEPRQPPNEWQKKTYGYDDNWNIVKKGVAEDWQKANKRDRTAGMSQKAVNAYRRENPGSKLKTAVTTKPSKLKKGSKASKRRKSYCSRSRGQMKMHSISCAKTPDKAICKARRRWNC